MWPLSATAFALQISALKFLWLSHDTGICFLSSTSTAFILDISSDGCFLGNHTTIFPFLSIDVPITNTQATEINVLAAMPTSWLPFYTEPLQMCFLSFIPVFSSQEIAPSSLGPRYWCFWSAQNTAKENCSKPTTGSIVREDFDILKLQSAISISHRVLGNTF